MAARTAPRMPEDEAVVLHRAYGGKIQTLPKCALTTFEDLAIWYTPGVAAASRAIAAAPAEAFELTSKGNTVAILSDGSRVLGLGDIGPLAGLPVMEGKALLMKHLGGVDAVALCIAAHEPEEIVSVAEAVAPSFGGINLEDIASPKCFEVLDRARERLPIPVWHDDQQGTATVVLAGLLNALEVVGKRLAEVRIALIGIGAANMAVFRLLIAEGVDPAQIVACDRVGTLHAGRSDIESQAEDLAEKWQVCQATNPDRRQGGIAEALAGADVCLAFSSPGPGTIAPKWVAAMAPNAIVFACANPVPEISPSSAKAVGAAIVATGRSDYDNQVNNSLAFPGVFRGVFDVRARRISEKMARAAAEAIARSAHGRLSAEFILPRMDEIEVAAETAAAVGMAAQAEGLAGLARSREALVAGARTCIEEARRASEVLIAAGLIRKRHGTKAAGHIGKRVRSGRRRSAGMSEESR